MERGAWFDPHTSFFGLKMVKVTVAAVSISALAVTMTILFSSMNELKFNLSYEGFNNLLNIFKFPLGIFAILIPAIALLVANHRSEQTKAQMELTKDQLHAANSNNNFSNYFKHTEEFEKYLNAHQNNENDQENNLASHPKFKSPRRLHKHIFPGAKHGNYNVKQDFFEEIDVLILDLLNISEGFATRSSMSTAGRELQEQYNVICDKFQISLANPIKIVESEAVLPNDIRDSVRPIGLLANAFNTAGSFDENYKPSRLLDVAAEFDFNSLHTNSSRRADGYVPFSLKQRLFSDMQTRYGS